MKIHHFFDTDSSTLTYVVWDEDSKDAVIIDPVLDFDMLAVNTKTTSNDHVVNYVKEHGLNVHYVLETHVHADHLSGSQDLKERLQAKTGIGSEITKVQALFKGVFGSPESFAVDGSQFDVLFGDGEVVEAGSLSIRGIHTPGHTPACTTYEIGGELFVGDALFIPDFGTGRCDFPAGSAQDLYASVSKKLYTYPDATKMYVGHDYQPGGRELRAMTTVGESKSKNIQLRGDTTEAEFVKFRTERDAVLRPPRLIFQAVQVNMDAGRMPSADGNGQRHLKLPIGVFG